MKKLNVGDSVKVNGRVGIVEDYDDKYYYVKDDNTNIVKIEKVQDEEVYGEDLKNKLAHIDVQLRKFAGLEENSIFDIFTSVDDKYDSNSQKTIYTKLKLKVLRNLDQEKIVNKFKELLKENNIPVNQNYKVDENDIFVTYTFEFKDLESKYYRQQSTPIQNRKVFKEYQKLIEEIIDKAKDLEDLIPLDLEEILNDKTDTVTVSNHDITFIPTKNYQDKITMVNRVLDKYKSGDFYGILTYSEGREEGIICYGTLKAVEDFYSSSSLPERLDYEDISVKLVKVDYNNPSNYVKDSEPKNDLNAIQVLAKLKKAIDGSVFGDSYGSEEGLKKVFQSEIVNKLKSCVSTYSYKGQGYIKEVEEDVYEAQISTIDDNKIKIYASLAFDEIDGMGNTGAKILVDGVASSGDFDLEGYNFTLVDKTLEYVEDTD